MNSRREFASNRPSQNPFSKIIFDPVLQRDRDGHWTAMAYDPLRHLTDTYDNLGRHTQFSWCNCGSLESITDPLGNVTQFIRDLQSRVTTKVYPDLTAINYNYETNSSRLKMVTDAKNQSTIYSYFIDNNLKQVTYSNAVVATSNVLFTYDTNYNRMVTMTDGTGTTTYRYYSVASGQLGAGQLSSVSNSFIGSTSLIAYNYDALGRITNRAINGVSQQVAFDALHRVTVVTNVLGRFTNTYVGGTMLISTNFAPFGKKTIFSYLSITNDERLATILNQKTNGVTLSKFDYSYDPVGNITNWTQQVDTNTPTAYSYGYDAGNEVIDAVLKSTGAGASILKQYAYNYDLNGNRTGEQIGTTTNAPVAVSQSSYNNLNQVTSRTTSSGQLQFAGSLDKQGNVTINGNAATMNHLTTNFVGTASVSTGTNTVPIIATDYGNHSRTNKYQIVVTNNGVAETISYDLDGNMTNVVTASSTNSYQWDGAGRLISVTSPTNQSLFTYDGLGRCAQIVELTNRVTYVTNKFIWDEQTLAEQRDVTSAVTKRFFGQGEQISGTNYYFTRDHLGSVREMVDATGTVKVRYDYDPYGRQTKISGTIDADVGFARMYNHNPSGLYLTLFRVYNSDLSRWPNRDPIAEWGGLNLYAYVRNNPINLFDPLGLVDCGALAAAIANQENLIDGAIRSMSDINQMFNSTMSTQDAALAIEALEAGLGGDAMNAELKSYRAAPWTYQEGLKTAVIVGTAATAVDETKNRVVGAGVEKLTGLDIFDPANTMAESQEKMSENASASTYQTIRGLQGQLANMMDMYQQNCPCKK